MTLFVCVSPRGDGVVEPRGQPPHRQRPCAHVADHVGDMHLMQAHGQVQRRYRAVTTLDDVRQRSDGRGMAVSGRAG